MAKPMNMKELEKYINQKAASVLKNEIAETTVKIMQEKIDEVVYEQYSPKMYDRSGLLREDIGVEMVNDQTVSVENMRSEGSRNIAIVVETGEGYGFTSALGYNTYDDQGRTYERPRPFTEETRKVLKQSGILTYEMKQGLKKRGIDVK